MSSKPRKPQRIIDGWSESSWKSLTVKSQRIGWSEGLRQAAQRLSPSTMKSLLTCGLFEDTFPTERELPYCLQEIAAQDYDNLCARNTHHGRGYTDWFCDLEPHAIRAAEVHKPILWVEARARQFWLPPRALNCFWTWRVIMPQDEGAQRDIDETPWTGLPAFALDGHTLEGKQMGIQTTLLSGSYEQHRRLGELVQKRGWSEVREMAHSENQEATQ